MGIILMYTGNPVDPCVVSESSVLFPYGFMSGSIYYGETNAGDAKMMKSADGVTGEISISPPFLFSYFPYHKLYVSRSTC